MGTKLKVYVYYNLHKKCWSVKALNGPNKGRVIQHTQEIYLTDIEFRVSKAGRARVLRERKKNVHAGVVGYINQHRFMHEFTEVKYNPYKYDSFVVADDGTKVSKAANALLSWGKVYANQLIGVINVS